MRIKPALRRMKYDFEYIFLNQLVRHIPFWMVRRFFYRAMGMTIGKGSRIGINTIVVSPRGITLGERAIVNEMCYLDGRGGIRVGNDASISFGTTIITASHDMNQGFACYSDKTDIGDHVWIGAHAILLDGAKVESYAVIGAGCVFKGTAEPYGVYVGNPAKKVKTRDASGEYTMDYHPFFR